MKSLAESINTISLLKIKYGKGAVEMNGFQKNTGIVILYISMALFLTLSIPVISGISGAQSINGSLSENAVNIEIVSQNEVSPFLYGDMIEFIASTSDIVLIRENDFENSIEIYYSNEEKLSGIYKVVSGSDFSVVEIKTGKHSALVSSSYHVIDKSAKCFHRNSYYQIIGIIDGCEYDCITPLMTSLNDEREQAVSMTMLMDCGSNTAVVAEQLEEYVHGIDSTANMSVSSLSQKSESVIVDMGMIVIIFLSLLLVVLLCLESVAEQWVYALKKEMFVRLMVGATKTSVIKKYLLKLILVTTASSLMGVIFAIAIIGSKILGIGMNHISVPYAILAFAVLIIANLLGLLEVYFHIKSLLSDKKVL